LRGTNEGQEAGGALIKAAKADTILFCQMGLYRFDARFRKSLFE
jgi:hypothetical protein